MPGKDEEVLGEAIRSVADAITSQSAAPGHDSSGGLVGCLTEAVMGLTAAMNRMADGLSEIAQSIDALKEDGH